MKNLKFIYLILLVCFTTAAVYSQKGGHEYIQQKRVEYLTVNMDLSVEESQKFWPVYNEFSKKKTDLSESYKEKYGDFKKFEGAGEEDFKKALEGMVENRISQAELMKQYNAKYLQVLPAEKVYQLYRLEEEFNKNLMRQLRKPPPEQKKGKGKNASKK